MQITILGIERTDDDKNRIVIKADETITSIILTDAQISDVASAKAAINQRLQMKKYVGATWSLTL